MKKKLSMMGTTLQSRASIVGVTSPLPGVDSVNWGQLGPAFTVLSSPQSFVTNGGVSGQVSSAGGASNDAIRGMGGMETLRRALHFCGIKIKVQTLP
jgi:hypothetical protein